MSLLKGLLIGSSLLGGIVLLGWLVDKTETKVKEEEKKPTKPTTSAKKSSPPPKKDTVTPQQVFANAQKDIYEVERNVEQLKILASKETAKQNLYECLESEERLMQIQLKIDSVNEMGLKEEKKNLTRKIQSLLHALDSIRDALSDSPQNNTIEDPIAEIDSQPPILEVE